MKPIEDNLIEKRYRDYSLRLHFQRLNDIKTRGSHRIDNSCPRTKEIILPQQQGKNFVKKEKNNDITKDNNKFFEILVEISAGKRETATQKILNSAKESQNRKSLNISFRKKKEMKILKENEEFFRKIEKTSTDLSVDKFNKEWELCNKYKNTIKRKTPRYSSSEFVRTFYLPPLLSNIKEEKSSSRNDDSFHDIRKKKKGGTLKNFYGKNTEKKNQEEKKNSKEEIGGFFISEIDVGDVHEKTISERNEFKKGIEEISMAQEESRKNSELEGKIEEIRRKELGNSEALNKNNESLFSDDLKQEEKSDQEYEKIGKKDEKFDSKSENSGKANLESNIENGDMNV